MDHFGSLHKEEGDRKIRGPTGGDSKRAQT